MNLIFSIQQEKGRGENSWFWTLSDAEKKQEIIAKSAQFQAKNDAVIGVKTIIEASQSGNLYEAKKEDVGKNLKDSAFYLVTSNDPEWSIYKGNQLLGVGQTKLDADGAKGLIDSLGKSSVDIEADIIEQPDVTTGLSGS